MLELKKTQFSGFATSYPQLLRYNNENNKLELERITSMEHLPFSIGKKFDFINYAKLSCKPRNTLKCVIHKLFKHDTKKLCKLFLI